MMNINSKYRLFELMNRVSGMPVLNENNGSGNLDLPPGIESTDFTSLEKYAEEVPCSTEVNEENPNDFGANLKPVKNINKFLTDKDNEIKAGKQTYNTGARIHGTTMKNITQDNGFDIDKLKEILTKVPTTGQFLKQNGKMGKSNFYNVTLPAFKGLVYNQTDDSFYVVTVCDKAGECLRDCYAQMGRYIMFDSTVKLNTQKLNYLMNNWSEWKERMINTIKSLSFSGGGVIRWHDSGDFLSEKYLQLAFEIARATPNDYHYAYTKEVNMVKRNEIPPNFEIKYSYGGKEDDSIDKSTDGHAVVVPEELFKDLKPKGKGSGWSFPSESIEIILDRISEKYGLDRSTVITHDELMNMGYDPKETHERKWNVVSWMGKTDIPALRKDVSGIYNLKHS